MNNFFTRTQKHGNTVFTFSSPVRVLSTSPLNGGITEHLSHIVNINCMNGSYECRMLGNTYEEDLAEHVRSAITEKQRQVCGSLMSEVHIRSDITWNGAE